MIATSGQTREQAGQLVLQLSLFWTWIFPCGTDAIDVEQAEAQALHAVGAAVVVDDREPRLPGAGLVHGAAARGRNSSTSSTTAAGVEAGDVARLDADPAGAILEAGGAAVERAEHQQRVIVVVQGALRSRVTRVTA